MGSPKTGGHDSQNNGIIDMQHLVLRRTPGEVVVIGEHGEIRITYHRLEGDEIYLGFEAPPNVIINRLEVHEKKVKEKSEASRIACAK